MTEKEEKTRAIDEYTEQTQERISKFHAFMSSLERAMQLLAYGEEAKPRRREDQEQEVEFRRILDQEKQLEEMRMRMRKQFEKIKEKKKEDPKVNLPKLVISKFEGRALGGFKFWNQSQTEIDQQDYVSPVTKYSHLKEFLLLHVGKLVDSLFFASVNYCISLHLTSVHLSSFLSSQGNSSSKVW